MRKETTHEWFYRTRPWWWIVNPWLYIKRRDAAYASALETVEELSLLANQQATIRGK